MITNFNDFEEYKCTPEFEKLLENIKDIPYDPTAFEKLVKEAENPKKFINEKHLPKNLEIEIASQKEDMTIIKDNINTIIGEIKKDRETLSKGILGMKKDISEIKTDVSEIKDVLKRNDIK